MCHSMTCVRLPSSSPTYLLHPHPGSSGWEPPDPRALPLEYWRGSYAVKRPDIEHWLLDNSQSGWGEERRELRRLRQRSLQDGLPGAIMTANRQSLGGFMCSPVAGCKASFQCCYRSVWKNVEFTETTEVFIRFRLMFTRTRRFHWIR